MLVFTAAGFFLSGMAGSFGFDSTVGSLMTIIPILCLIMAILGIWSVVKDHRAGKLSYGVLLLPGWPAGTIIGLVVLGLLFATQSKVPPSLSHSSTSESH